MVWKNGWGGKSSSTTSSSAPPQGQDTSLNADGNTTTATGDVNSLAARCERWLALHLDELANETAALISSAASPPPSPPALCPCLDDVMSAQVRHARVFFSLFFRFLIFLIFLIFFGLRVFFLLFFSHFGLRAPLHSYFFPLTLAHSPLRAGAWLRPGVPRRA